MLYTLIMVIHILISLVLCVVVLLQSSKGGGLAGAFGGGGGAPQQIFGSRGMTTILHKVTIYCAVGFFVTSASLFLLTGTRNRGPASLGDALRETGAGDATPPPTRPADAMTLPPITTGDEAAPAATAGDAGGAGDGDQPEGDEPSGR